MKKVIYQMLIAVIAVVVTGLCSSAKDTEGDKFVRVVDGHFVRNGSPYYYVGTNFWYGAILGSEGRGGNRTRLCQELDDMKAMGISDAFMDDFGYV